MRDILALSELAFPFNHILGHKKSYVVYYSTIPHESIQLLVTIGSFGRYKSKAVAYIIQHGSNHDNNFQGLVSVLLQSDIIDRHFVLNELFGDINGRPLFNLTCCSVLP